MYVYGLYLLHGMDGRVPRWLVRLLVTAAILTVTCSEVKKKKNVLDYNDADVERIFREWEVSVDLSHNII